MTLEECRNHIKLMLTGSVLHLELSDDTLNAIIATGIREIQRYIDQTKLITVPFAKCIDLTNFNVSSVTAIYRTKGYLSSIDDGKGTEGDIDPFQAQIWKVFSNNGSMYNLNDYVMNYAAFASLLQMRSAQSTDLAFKYDRAANKLYINTNDNPVSMTIEYIPQFVNIEDIKSDYWIEILQRLCVALTKQICGRVRSRYKQSNALWTQDGDTLLAEANEELTQIREVLRANEQQFYPID